VTSNQCACAHSKVLLKPIEYPNGARSDHWECSDCGTEFWPNVPGKRPRPGTCTCPPNGVSSGCPTHGAQQGETTAEQKYSEKDVAAITAAIDAVREEKSVTGVCVGGRATLGGNDIMLLKVPSGSYGIGVRYAIRAVKATDRIPGWCNTCTKPKHECACHK
jgi:hypothetical protein